VVDSPDGERAAHFLKTLANETRLRIVGCLSLGPLTRSELSTRLGLRLEEAARHVRMLCVAGLIVEDVSRATPELRLETAWLRAGNDLTKIFARTAGAHGGGEPESAESKILAAFVREDRIVRIPVAVKKQLVLLRWLVERFDEEREYPEREVNAILKDAHPDFAALRRMLVDHGFMRRDHGIYRRENQSARTG